MGKTADRQQYIHNLAGTILGGDYVYPRDARELYHWYVGVVATKLSHFTDQTLGKIVACGISTREADIAKNTSLSAVQGYAPLDLRGDGRSLLQEIAVTAIIAATMDIIKARTKKG